MEKLTKQFKNQYKSLSDFQVEVLAEIAKNWALELVNTPCREGDGLPEDEIIEDNIQQAHVRQTIKFAIEESIK